MRPPVPRAITTLAASSLCQKSLYTRPIRAYRFTHALEHFIDLEGAMRIRSGNSWALLSCVVLISSTMSAQAGVHLWRIEEIFSDPSGTVQFIEMATCCNSTGETFTAGHLLRSNANTFTFPGNLTGTTFRKHLLLATDGYDAIPGAPPRDYEIPANFFSVTGDSISFETYDVMTFGAGVLPTNGTTSLNKDPDDPLDLKYQDVNSPTNFNDQTGSITVTNGPPGVPDGKSGSTPMTVQALTPDASSLRVSFDTATCTNDAAYHILYGQRSGFPAAPGGTYTLLGSVCGIGTASPYDWAGVPVPNDGFGLIWWVLVTTDSSFVEGSWGKDYQNNQHNERNGTGNNGADGTCALVKNVSNACGQ
jgi:hypothetical protein